MNKELVIKRQLHFLNFHEFEIFAIFPIKECSI